MGSCFVSAEHPGVMLGDVVGGGGVKANRVNQMGPVVARSLVGRPDSTDSLANHSAGYGIQILDPQFNEYALQKLLGRHAHYFSPAAIRAFHERCQRGSKTDSETLGRLYRNLNVITLQNDGLGFAGLRIYKIVTQFGCMTHMGKEGLKILTQAEYNAATFREVETKDIGAKPESDIKDAASKLIEELSVAIASKNTKTICHHCFYNDDSTLKDENSILIMWNFALNIFSPEELATIWQGFLCADDVAKFIKYIYSPNNIDALFDIKLVLAITALKDSTQPDITLETVLEALLNNPETTNVGVNLLADSQIYGGLIVADIWDKTYEFLTNTNPHWHKNLVITLKEGNITEEDQSGYFPWQNNSLKTDYVVCANQLKEAGNDPNKVIKTLNRLARLAKRAKHSYETREAAIKIILTHSMDESQPDDVRTHAKKLLAPYRDHFDGDLDMVIKFELGANLSTKARMRWLARSPKGLSKLAQMINDKAPYSQEAFELYINASKDLTGNGGRPEIDLEGLDLSKIDFKGCWVSLKQFVFLRTQANKTECLLNITDVSMDDVKALDIALDNTQLLLTPSKEDLLYIYERGGAIILGEKYIKETTFTVQDISQLAQCGPLAYHLFVKILQHSDDAEVKTQCIKEIFRSWEAKFENSRKVRLMHSFIKRIKDLEALLEIVTEFNTEYHFYNFIMSYAATAEHDENLRIWAINKLANTQHPNKAELCKLFSLILKNENKNRSISEKTGLLSSCLWALVKLSNDEAVDILSWFATQSAGSDLSVDRAIVSLDPESCFHALKNMALTHSIDWVRLSAIRAFNNFLQNEVDGVMYYQLDLDHEDFIQEMSGLEQRMQEFYIKMLESLDSVHTRRWGRQLADTNRIGLRQLGQFLADNKKESEEFVGDKAKLLDETINGIDLMLKRAYEISGPEYFNEWLRVTPLLSFVKNYITYANQNTVEKLFRIFIKYPVPEIVKILIPIMQTQADSWYSEKTKKDLIEYINGIMPESFLMIRALKEFAAEMSEHDDDLFYAALLALTRNSDTTSLDHLTTTVTYRTFKKCTVIKKALREVIQNHTSETWQKKAEQLIQELETPQDSFAFGLD